MAANREDPRIRVLGLLADPDLPAELAEELAGELPRLLQEHLGDRVAWEVRAVCEPFAAAEVDQGQLLAVARQRLGREGMGPGDLPDRPAVPQRPGTAGGRPERG